MPDDHRVGQNINKNGHNGVKGKGMSIWDIQRTVVSARILTDLAVELGMPEAKVLAGTGISAAQLRSAEALVEARQELRLISNMVDGLGHVPGLGVLAGMRYHFNAFGALGFALVSSSTLRDAIEIGLKYVQLTFAFCAIELKDRDREVYIRFRAEGIPEKLRRFIVERDSACCVTLQTDIFRNFSPIKYMCFEFETPVDVASYETFYGVQPRFGEAGNDMVVDRDQLNEPLPQASELARSAAEVQCDALLNQRLERAGLSARIRQYLAGQARDMPGMEEVAKAMNTIPRTLRRHLSQENTSFAELRDEVRQALAEEYLAGPKLSVEQVAERLGYSSSTSFINAYKRWYGTTPAAKRAGELMEHGRRSC